MKKLISFRARSDSNPKTEALGSLGSLFLGGQKNQARFELIAFLGNKIPDNKTQKTFISAVDQLWYLLESKSGKISELDEFEIVGANQISNGAPYKRFMEAQREVQKVTKDLELVKLYSILLYLFDYKFETIAGNGINFSEWGTGGPVKVFVDVEESINEHIKLNTLLRSRSQECLITPNPMSSEEDLPQTKYYETDLVDYFNKMVRSIRDSDIESHTQRKDTVPGERTLPDSTVHKIDEEYALGLKTVTIEEVNDTGVLANYPETQRRLADLTGRGDKTMKLFGADSDIGALIRINRELAGHFFFSFRPTDFSDQSDRMRIAFRSQFPNIVAVGHTVRSSDMYPQAARIRRVYNRFLIEEFVPGCFKRNQEKFTEESISNQKILLQLVREGLVKINVPGLRRVVQPPKLKLSSNDVILKIVGVKHRGADDATVQVVVKGKNERIEISYAEYKLRIGKSDTISEKRYNYEKARLMADTQPEKLIQLIEENAKQVKINFKKVINPTFIRYENPAECIKKEVRTYFQALKSDLQYQGFLTEKLVEQLILEGFVTLPSLQKENSETTIVFTTDKIEIVKSEEKHQIWKKVNPNLITFAENFDAVFHKFQEFQFLLPAKVIGDFNTAAKKYFRENTQDWNVYRAMMKKEAAIKVGGKNVEVKDEKVREKFDEEFSIYYGNLPYSEELWIQNENTTNYLLNRVKVDREEAKSLMKLLHQVQQHGGLLFESYSVDQKQLGSMFRNREKDKLLAGYYGKTLDNLLRSGVRRAFASQQLMKSKAAYLFWDTAYIDPKYHKSGLFGVYLKAVAQICSTVQTEISEGTFKF